MASLAPVFHQQSCLYDTTQLGLSSGNVRRNLSFDTGLCGITKMPVRTKTAGSRGGLMAVIAATTVEKLKKWYPGEANGLVEEMRFVAMKLHTREQAKQGEKEVKVRRRDQWLSGSEPTVDGSVRFLADSKLVYDTLDRTVENDSFPFYVELRNTGLERSEKLAKDLEWFKEQGYTIPEPSSPGVNSARYLDELLEKDPQSFICHFYNVYFAQSAVVG